jgi:asparagine synthase (glutamine-hydrolysing)
VLTFSIGFEDPRYDERQYAQAVAAHLGTTHHSAVVHPHAAEDLPKLAAVFGEPFGDSSALPTHYLARETRQFVKVALSGDGGDELFGGYDRYRAMVLQPLLNRIPAPLRALLAGPASACIRATHPKSRLARAKRLLQSLNLPPAERYASYLTLFSPAMLQQLLLPPLREAVGPCNTLATFMSTILTATDTVPSALAVDRQTYLPGDLLTKVDRAAMLHNLEVRSPFMDPDVVDFAASLTTPQLLAGGPKRLLREAFAPDLPAWVFRRKKMGFALPIGDWLRTTLRPMLHDLLFAADSFAASHFQRATLDRLLQEHESARQDHSQRLYSLLMLELWHRLP